MRPFTHTISLAEALARMREVTRPIERTAVVAVPEAAWRVVATDVVATRDVPPFDRAAMDGYAVRASDTAGATRDRPAMLTCVGVVFSGEAWTGHLGQGECVEIATGAPVPDGADAVVMVEHTAPAGAADGGGPAVSPSDPWRGAAAVGTRVAVFGPVSPRQHVASRGADIGTGQVVLRRGDHLTPARLGAAAALGVTHLEVFEPTRVFIASTGDELVDTGGLARAAQIYDVNRTTLPPIVALHGGVPLVHPVVGDTLAELRAALDAARDADLVVVSGGSSVGNRDLLVDVVAERGDILFHGIAVKPGKPTLLAHLGSQLLLGLPGNPTSCLSNAYLLLVPLLRALARLPQLVPQTRRVPLLRTIVSPGDRHQFYTVRLEDGHAVAAFKGSGDITSMAGADGYIEIPAGTDRIEAGATVDVVLF
jgi:molybdenum cofactor synthesis domain-containing protein